ncbi:MAG: glycosyltransferase [Candidatus Binatia bacterium]
MITVKADAFRCSYLLPLLHVRADQDQIEDFAQYFRCLAAEGCEVIVVDGSTPEIFTKHNRVWSQICRHVAVDPKYTYLNGKVNGVHTGVDLASCENIILADDDIRYTADDLRNVCDLLCRYEMVRPQNYISPLPWWGRIETARMLINRGVLMTGDYPGTCAFRRSVYLRVGHYDGDVLFDNEEIVRHFRLNGASVCCALGTFILKRPPSFSKWLEQRPRQAFEDFDMRAKTLLFLALFPIAIMLGFFSGARGALQFFFLVAVCALLLACRGLWRSKAYNYFPLDVILFAPLWVLERAASVYWALYWRVVYGGYPFGNRVLTKGTGRAWVAGRVHRRQPTAVRACARPGCSPGRRLKESRENG